MPQPICLFDIVSDPEALLGLSIEELGMIVLRLLKDTWGGQNVNRAYISASGLDQERESRGMGYPRERRAEIGLALTEAWSWLEANTLLVPLPGDVNPTGWRMLSRKARRLSTNDDYARFRAAAAFPKELLHPKIADKTWLALMRGDLADAVFSAFKAVEVAVRATADYGSGEKSLGVKLMRRAFEPKDGPLSDPDQDPGEAEALMHLFGGAIGSCRNPHGHRETNLDIREAQQMVVLASQLLDIVDARVKLRAERRVG